MSVKVVFDLDGTIYDLYNQKDWLYRLENEVAGVFDQPECCIVDIKKLTDKIMSMIEKGFQFAIISWLPFGASPEYEEICREEKACWIWENLPMITEVSLIPYGIEKQKAIQKKAQHMILIDDNKEVCNVWETATQRKAFTVGKCYTVLNVLDDIELRYEGCL